MLSEEERQLRRAAVGIAARRKIEEMKRMSIKHEWKTTRNREEVKDAAVRRLAHYQGRYDYWLGKRKEVMAKIKEDGLDISESVAAAEAYNTQKLSNYNRNPQVKIRTEYQDDLNECSYKIQEHKEKVNTYKGWVEFLSAVGPKEIDLQIEDHLFFFGGDC